GPRGPGRRGAGSCFVVHRGRGPPAVASPQSAARRAANNTNKIGDELMTDCLAHEPRRAGRGLARTLLAAPRGMSLLCESPATAQFFGYGQDEEPLPPPT